MADLAGFGGVLQAINWIYWIAAAVALWFAWAKPAHRHSKIVATTLVASLFLAFPAVRIYQALSYQHRYAKAKALFDERCKTAVQRIYRTVEGVEGVLLLKIRQSENKSDPMMPGAAAAHEFSGDDYIKSFLMYEKDPLKGPRTLQDAPSSRPGYRYVDAEEYSSGKIYRYTLDPSGTLRRTEAATPPPRYGVTYEDIVDPTERSQWVAGSIVKVIDLADQETVGEWTRYVFEPGLGSNAGQRVPWLFARGCNMTTSYGSYSPRLFVDQFIKPVDEKLK